jgi:FxsC-like protein
MPFEDYLYFVSYARDDLYIRRGNKLEEDPFLSDFFADLREAVRSKAGRLQEDRVDFRDTEQTELGQPWRQAVAEALQASRTLVALYSPTYFTRPECGKEVRFMQMRCECGYPGGNAPHGFVIPVIWEACPEGVIPKGLADLNYFQAALPPEYKQHGMRVLARHKAGGKFAPEYEQSVQAIASHINAMRLKPLLPKVEPMPDYAKVSDAFSPGTPAGAAVASKAKGPSAVRIAYIAATHPELQGKAYVAPYGEKCEEWRPSTTDDRAVGMLAPYVAAANKFFYYQLPVDGTFQAEVAKAQKENALVVLLVDVWSACVVPKYRALLQQYDSSTSVHCAALVVWNEGDTDLTAKQNHLETVLQKIVFPVNQSRPAPYFRPSVKTMPELETALRDTLERLRIEVINQAEAFRALEALEYATKPAVLNTQGG